jgi:hypothetical protein
VIVFIGANLEGIFLGAQIAHPEKQLVGKGFETDQILFLPMRRRDRPFGKFTIFSAAIVVDEVGVAKIRRKKSASSIWKSASTITAFAMWFRRSRAAA